MYLRALKDKAMVKENIKTEATKKYLTLSILLILLVKNLS